MELRPLPFSVLLRRVRREAERRQAIFDLPAKKWHAPDPALGPTPDFSAVHFGRPAATPLGPAAGPHTQLAQNLVLSWLGGGRILELKTVQINDRLEIPRPCIHAPNVGYNVEWSQELRIAESAREYAKAAYLIEILKATRAFGLLPDAGTASFDTIFDISVGYDLEGIRSVPVTSFLEVMRDPQPLFNELRQEITGDPELAEFRDLELPEAISECVTLSTFHGCPADQIEAICEYLIRERGFDTLIKLNPTLLGYETVRELLHERLGYTHLELDRAAFDVDLRYADGLEILRRLRRVAKDHGTEIGAKFTNTLVVQNRADYFPTQSDPHMYLSGAPLHVISMNLMQRFREDLGFMMPISFSAGIDARNFPDAVACGMVPITTCTDLLRQGGYGRLPGYLKNLGRAFEKTGVGSREAFVLAARGHGAAAVRSAIEKEAAGAALWRAEGEHLSTLAEDDPSALPQALRDVASAAGLDGERLAREAVRAAGRLNGREIVPKLASDERYHASRNAKEPRRIDSRLELYDCINCDLCIAACPNDAIFAYEATPVETASERLRLTSNAVESAAGRGFAIHEAHQLAVLEEGCNECSNCEVYCPEEGAPFRVKELVFRDREAFERARTDGFCRDDGALLARLEGYEWRLLPEPEHNRAVVTGRDARGEGFELSLEWDSLVLARAQSDGGPIELDTAVLWRLKTVWNAIYGAEAPNMVNV